MQYLSNTFYRHCHSQWIWLTEPRLTFSKPHASRLHWVLPTSTQGSSRLTPARKQLAGIGYFYQCFASPVRKGTEDNAMTVQALGTPLTVHARTKLCFGPICAQGFPLRPKVGRISHTRSISPGRVNGFPNSDSRFFRIRVIWNGIANSSTILFSFVAVGSEARRKSPGNISSDQVAGRAGRTTAMAPIKKTGSGG